MALSLAAFPCATTSEPMATAILYPDIREPFRGVFLSIAQGIRERVGGRVELLAVSEDDDLSGINPWLVRNGIGSVVALGSRGQSLSEALSDSVPVVIGAIHMSPDVDDREYYGLSLSPDPDVMLRRLVSLAPGVRRVTIVHHRERDAWMVDSARAVARRLGIELNAIPVDRLQDAVSAYREVLRDQRSGVDALWLSQDSAALDEQAVLPMILREAWDRKLIVFSSNPSHVRRGTLFALYPDNDRMGRRLGEMANHAREMRTRNGANPSGMELLRELSLAFNVRTAGHLGVRYPRALLDEADLVFPSM